MAETGPAEPIDNAASMDPLNAVSTAARVWRKAAAAWVEREALDRAIVRAFDLGRAGVDIAAASGLALEDVYRVHRRLDEIKADEALDARVAETRRRSAELARRLRPSPSDQKSAGAEVESSAESVLPLPDSLGSRWRVGHDRRTIYAMAVVETGDRDVLIGMMDTAALAQEVCTAHNNKVKDLDE